MPWVIHDKAALHRLILPSLLHVGIAPLFFNICVQFALGTLVESMMGGLRYIIFFLVVVLGSNIFGALCTAKYALGSEPIAFGCLGAMLAVIFVYWDRIEAEFQQKFCMVFMIVLVGLYLVMIMSMVSGSLSLWAKFASIVVPDIYGCIGGFLYGVFSALFLLPQEFRKNGKCQIKPLITVFVGLGLVLLMTIVMVPFLFTGETPKKYWFFEEAPEKKLL